jgi:hypothetical protein
MGCNEDAAMIPYQVDPSLHPDRRAPEQLDDGFSPPAGSPPQAEPAPGQRAEPVEAQWPAKSDF